MHVWHNLERLNEWAVVRSETQERAIERQTGIEWARIRDMPLCYYSLAIPVCLYGLPSFLSLSARSQFAHSVLFSIAPSQVSLAPHPLANPGRRHGLCGQVLYCHETGRQAQPVHHPADRHSVRADQPTEVSPSAGFSCWVVLNVNVLQCLSVW